MTRVDAQQKHIFTLPEGSWTLKRLGMLDQQRVPGQATLLLGCPFGDAPVASQENAWMWATITVATVTAPDGWDWNAQPDTDVLMRLHSAYVDWDASFCAPVAPRTGVASPDAGTESSVLVSPDLPVAPA